jgi:hypothetical protein
MSRHRGHCVHHSRTDKTKALFWEAKLDGYGQSVDQRIKFAGWMKEFTKRGGSLVIKDANAQDIDSYGKSHDLVLVASGKGEINRLFERDAEKSAYDRPMRALALTYVKKMVPRKPFWDEDRPPGNILA